MRVFKNINQKIGNFFIFLINIFSCKDEIVFS